jgi:hypothetical protein
MSRRRFSLVSFATVAIIGVSFLAWMVFQPGPYAFAAGHPVDLASYAGPSPTGVPAELAAADARTRGEYEELVTAARAEMARLRGMSLWHGRDRHFNGFGQINRSRPGYSSSRRSSVWPLVHG